MRPPTPLKIGNVLELKKAHPCGDNRWEITGLGIDIRLKCQACQRVVSIPRAKLERRIKRILGGEPAG